MRFVQRFIWAVLLLLFASDACGINESVSIAPPVTAIEDMAESILFLQRHSEALLSGKATAHVYGAAQLISAELIPLTEVLDRLPAHCVVKHEAEYGFWDGEHLRPLESNVVGSWLITRNARCLITIEGWNALIVRDLATLTTKARFEIPGGNYSVVETAATGVVLVTNGLSVTAINVEDSLTRSFDVGISDWLRIAPDAKSILIGSTRYAIESAKLDQWVETILHRGEAAELAEQWIDPAGLRSDQKPIEIRFPARRAESSQWQSQPMENFTEARGDAALAEALARAASEAAPRFAALPHQSTEITAAVDSYREDDALSKYFGDLSASECPPAHAYSYELYTFSGRLFLLCQASAGNRYGCLDLIEVSRGTPLRALSYPRHGDSAGVVGNSKDGALLTISDLHADEHGSFDLIDLDSFTAFTRGEQPPSWGPEENQWTWSPDGNALAVANDLGEVWVYQADRTKRTIVLDVRLPSDQWLGIRPTSLGDGEHSDDTGIWPASPWRERPLLAWPAPDLLLMAARQGTLMAINLRALRPAWRREICADGSSQVDAVRALPLNGVFATLRHGTVQLWSVHDGAPITQPFEIPGTGVSLATYPNFGIVSVYAENTVWSRRVAGTLTPEADWEHLLRTRVGCCPSEAESRRVSPVFDALMP